MLRPANETKFNVATKALHDKLDLDGRAMAAKYLHYMLEG